MSQADIQETNHPRLRKGKKSRKSPGTFPTIPIHWEDLAFLDGADRAGICAGAAGDAGIGIDDILAVAFGNCADGALLSTGAAAATGAGNDVSHSSYLHTMMSFFVLKRIYILAWIPENAIPFFPNIRSICFPDEKSTMLPFCIGKSE